MMDMVEKTIPTTLDTIIVKMDQVIMDQTIPWFQVLHQETTPIVKNNPTLLEERRAMVSTTLGKIFHYIACQPSPIEPNPHGALIPAREAVSHKHDTVSETAPQCSTNEQHTFQTHFCSPRAHDELAGGKKPVAVDSFIFVYDRDISRVMAHATNKIRKVYISPFSPQIKQVRLRRRFYKLHLLMMINNLDLHTQLMNLTHTLDEAMPAPPAIDEARQLLRNAQKLVRETTKRAAEL
jgi:hypothetical protein